MKVIAAYLLAVLGGNASPDAAAINKILDSVGASAEGEEVDRFLGEVSGKNIWTVVADGTAKLASAPTGGAAVSAPTGGVAPVSSGAAEEKKEEEKKQESDVDVGGGMDLFGGEGGDDY